MKRLLVAACLALAVFGVSCSRSATSPTPPREPVQNAPPPVPVESVRTLRGFVSDTAFRPLGGVRLEVVNGPDAGKELSSDAQGAFSYVGTFVGTVSIRASKEGYAATTSAVFAGAGSDVAWAFFSLAPVAPPIDASGNYTLTIAVDSACPGFPDEARVRSYPVRLTKRTSPTIPANTWFDGQISGSAQFAPFVNLFWVGIAGDYLAVSTEGEGPSIVEQLAPKTYIGFQGVAGATIPAGSPATISAPFRGTIEYCELKSAIGQYYDCSDHLAAVKVQCTGANSRLTLTPR
jgi:hypothetical protein